MKKSIVGFLITFSLWANVYGQGVIDKGLYKVKFDNALRAPRWVSYTLLYKEKATDCDRKTQHFKFYNDEIELKCGNEKEDYDGTGYHMGHLANAEDFSFTCEAMEKTFRLYNCLHQTGNLNTGKWKTYENRARKWSQEKGKLYIICGASYSNKRIGKNKVAVPIHCWKVIQVVKTKEILFCGWFTNTTQSSVEEITIEALGNKLGSTIKVLK